MLYFDGYAGFFRTLLLALVAPLLFGSVVFVAYGITARLSRYSTGVVRWCGLYGVACWTLSVVFHVLASLRLFSFTPALVVWFGLAILASLCFMPFGAFRRSVSADWTRMRAIGRAAPFPFRWTLVPLFFVAACALLRTLLLPMAGWDSLTYHGLKAGIWIQAGGGMPYEAPGPWEYYRSFPGGGEVFNAWAMLVFHSDFLASLPDFFHWLALGLVSFALCREFKRDLGWSLSVGCVLLTAPVIIFSVGSGYTDQCLAACLLNGVLFTSRYLRNGRPGDLLIAFATIGVAGAVRFTAWFPLVLLIPLLAGWSFTRRDPLRRILYLAAGGLVLLLPAVRWLVINQLETGSVIGSIPLSLGSVQLGSPPPSFEWFLDRPDLEPYVWAAELRAFRAAAKPFAGYLLLLPVVLISLLFRNKLGDGDDRLASRRWSAAAVLAVVFGTAALHFSPGFSVVRLGWDETSGRFLIPAFVLVMVFGPPRLSRVRSQIGHVLGLLTLVLVLRHTWSYSKQLFGSPEETRFLVASLAVGVLVLVMLRVLTSARGGWPFPARSVVPTLSIVALALTLACGAHAGFRHLGLRLTTFVHGVPRYWVYPLALLDSEPGRKTIAVTAGPIREMHTWFVFPFLGKDLENEVCYVSPERSGQLLPYAPRYLRRADRDYEGWIGRLRERRVTHVMSFVPRTWELNAMRQHPAEFDKLAEGSGWGLFRLKDPPSKQDSVSGVK